MKRYLAICLAVILLSATACGSAPDTSGDDGAVATTTTTTTTTTTVNQPAALPEEPFLSVLKGQRSFDLHGTETWLSDAIRRVSRCAVVDMDADGAPEVAVECQDTVVVLHLADGIVYGQEYRVQAMYRINTDGSFYWNSNAGKTQGCSSLRFGTEWEWVEHWRVEYDEADKVTYYVEDQQVWEDAYHAVVEQNPKTEIQWAVWSE